MEKEGKNLKHQSKHISSNNDSIVINSTHCDSLNIILNKNNNHIYKDSHESKTKHNNFYKALRLLKNTINSTQQNLSEFSEANLNSSKEENIRNYLHKPITKDIVKQGNTLMRVSFHTSYSTSINIPYSMNNIFKTFLPKIVEIEKDEEKTTGNNISTLKNKKSTAAYSNKNDSFKSSREEVNAEVRPFTLEVIDDLDEVKDLDIKKYTSSKEEILIVDSLLKEPTTHRQNFNNTKNYTTTDKKIPQKFKRNKLIDELEVESDEDFNINNHCINELQTEKCEIFFGNDNYGNSGEKINKNLMTQFNTCSNNNGNYSNGGYTKSNHSKETSKSPSAEMLDFISLGGEENNSIIGTNTRKNVISSSMLENNNITPIKKNINFYDTSSSKKIKKTPTSRMKQFNIFPTNLKSSLKGKNLTKSKSFLFLTKTNSKNSNNSNSLSLSLSITPKKINSSTSFVKKSLSFLSSSTFVNAGQTIYDLEFYNNLLSSEKKFVINHKAIEQNHPALTWDNRTVLLDWLMRICEEFAFKRDTFHYAINYIDRFLSKTKNIQKSLLQLIAITSLSIAAKIEEVQIPKLLEYANTTNDQFTVEDIINYEQFLLMNIKWEIIPITINTWVNWYICQWDLFIDTVDGIKDKILIGYSEDEILYFKKSDDKSYYNYRKITQLIDLLSLDYNSLDYNQRFLVGGCIFLVMCLHYGLEYDFLNKQFISDEIEKYQGLWEVFCSFVNQSFDIEVKDIKFFKCMSYCWRFKSFEFNFDLPLVYQVEENEVENGNYEDFVSYQTYNSNNLDFLKKLYCEV